MVIATLNVVFFFASLKNILLKMIILYLILIKNPNNKSKKSIAAERPKSWICALRIVFKSFLEVSVERML